MLEEVERVLHHPRLIKRFALTESEITQFVAFLAASAEIVEVDETHRLFAIRKTFTSFRPRSAAMPITSALLTSTSMKPRFSRSVQNGGLRSFPISNCYVWFAILHGHEEFLARGRVYFIHGQLERTDRQDARGLWRQGSYRCPPRPGARHRHLA